jgi:hypothetical protein
VSVLISFGLNNYSDAASVCGAEGGRPASPEYSTIYDPGFEIARGSSVSAAEVRYFYDDQQGRCSPFSFKGDFGNYNNFKSAAECELFCAKCNCTNL